MSEKIYLYTDGSWTPETEGVSGYGFTVIKGDKEIIFGYGQSSSESRQILGELSAVMRGLKVCFRRKFHDVVVVYDYQGVGKWATGEWKRNKETTRKYKEFIDSITRKGMNVTFQWTKGHNGNKWNERADELANLGRYSGEHYVESI